MTVETNLDAYDSLDRALEEKRYWMQVMCLRRHCRKALGDELFARVRAFSFSSEHQTEDDDTSWASHHNCVRLDDGSTVAIPPFPRPEIPEWMHCNLKVSL